MIVVFLFAVFPVLINTHQGVRVVIAEFYTTISGLGFMITRYANVFEMDKTFVPVIVLMVLGVTLTSGLKRFERRIAPWSHANR